MLSFSTFSDPFIKPGFGPPVTSQCQSFPHLTSLAGTESKTVGHQNGLLYQKFQELVKNLSSVLAKANAPDASVYVQTWTAHLFVNAIVALNCLEGQNSCDNIISLFSIFLQVLLYYTIQLHHICGLQQLAINNVYIYCSKTRKKANLYFGLVTRPL